MSVDDSGFDKELKRALAQNSESSEADAELQSPSFGGGQQGYLTSLGGKYKIDLTKDQITFNDGRKERLLLPNLAFIVASDGNGDFGDIQEAIDFVSTIGGGTVLIKAGTYLPVNVIKLKSNVNLIGEGIGRTIIECINIQTLANQTAVELIGTVVTAAGTVSVTNGSLILNGTNTNFQAAGVQSGDSVYINGVPYEILTVNSDTQLVLRFAYRGNTKASSLTEVARPVKNSFINGITFRTATASGLRLLRAENIHIDSCEMYNFTGGLQYAGIKVDSAYNSIISQSYIHDNQRGILIGDILYPVARPTVGTGTTQVPFSLKISQNEIFNNIKDGIRAELAQYILIANNASKSNGESGVFLRMSKDCVLQDNLCVYNKDGIRLWSYDGGSQTSIAANCENINLGNNNASYNSQYGVQIRASISATATPQTIYPQYITISGGTISNNTTAGLIIHGATEFVGDSAETS